MKIIGLMVGQALGENLCLGSGIGCFDVPVLMVADDR